MLTEFHNDTPLPTLSHPHPSPENGSWELGEGIGGQGSVAREWELGVRQGGGSGELGEGEGAGS